MASVVLVVAVTAFLSGAVTAIFVMLVIGIRAAVITPYAVRSRAIRAGYFLSR